MVYIYKKRLKNMCSCKNKTTIPVEKSLNNSTPKTISVGQQQQAEKKTRAELIADLRKRIAAGTR